MQLTKAEIENISKKTNIPSHRVENIATLLPKIAEKGGIFGTISSFRARTCLGPFRSKYWQATSLILGMRSKERYKEKRLTRRGI